MPREMATVILVGAGPGDPWLLTRRAIDCLQRADVVLYDYLVHPNCLTYCRDDARLVCVGKRKGYHSKTQTAIHRLMGYYARRCQLIVRLKGGDPCVFGRGGEEMTYLRRRCIPFEVVPGVSSVHAVPTYAGIPATYRGKSRSVAWMTGTTQAGQAVMRVPDADTVVILMGITHVAALTRRLLQEKRYSKTTPVALIAWGTLAAQRTWIGTLGSLKDRPKDLVPPALMVVGNVVDLHASLDWIQNRPLHGRRVVLLRTLAQSVELETLLTRLGAEVVLMPLIAQVPIATAIRQFTPSKLRRFTHVVVTSPYGVRQLMHNLSQNGLDARALAGKTLVAVGPKTADVLAEVGLRADIVPAAYSQEGILEVLRDVKGALFLLPVAQDARSTLATVLRQRGAKVVTVVSTYKTVPRKRIIGQPRDGDWVVFTSSSTVKAFFGRFGALKKQIRCISIGPMTQATLALYTDGPIVMAQAATATAIAEALCAASEWAG
jgi:uroporphyrinogen III methyltransferase/synthase